MKEEATVMLKAPPRLLLGVSFLFWGAMHDQAVVALLAAILVEARHWTNLRWDFGIKGFARSWQLSMLLLIVSSVGLMRIDQPTSEDFLVLLSWLPFMMLPLGLAQLYARERGVPTVTFSFIARRRMEADRRAGRRVDLALVHLGYPFFVLILIGAGMGVGNLGVPGPVETRYAVGVLLLVGWAFFRMGGRRERPAAWVFGYVMALGLTVLLYAGVSFAYQYFLKGMRGAETQGPSAFETQSELGQVRRVQQSKRIVWRYHQERGPAPGLLKLASYNVPHRNYWQAGLRKQELAEQIEEARVAGGDFEKLWLAGRDRFVYHQPGRAAPDFQRVGRLVGLVSEQSLIPHPSRTTRFEGVPTEVLTVNSLGAFQMTGVKQGAMEARLYSDPRGEPVELDPTEEDLVFLESEEEGLRSFLEELGLEVPPDQAVKEGASRRRVGPEFRFGSLPEETFRELEGRLARSFREDFQYTLFLKNGNLHAPITEFLKEVRSGHCEYFAGATAMLLRRMGIPCRYVVGFAVEEKSGEREWVLRGRHAHAWAQAYVGGSWVNEGSPDEPVWRCRGGRWVDVDLTPADWSAVSDELGWAQWFSDLFQKLRADLILWTSQPGLVSGLKIFLMVVGLLGLSFLAYRLFVTRGREGARESGPWDERVAVSGALRDLERWLAKRVGPRPRALPMGSWLRQSLPPQGGALVEWYERASFRDGEVDEQELREVLKKVRRHWLENQKNPGAGEPAGSG